MSIYLVRAKKWWVCRNGNTKEMNKAIKLERDMIKSILKSGRITCNKCGKKITLKNWKVCYLSDAFAYGFDDAYCNKKCYME